MLAQRVRIQREVGWAAFVRTARRVDAEVNAETFF
jgi:hypothetical protein